MTAAASTWALNTGADEVVLYTDLAKQTFKPLEGMVAKFAPAATH